MENFVLPFMANQEAPVFCWYYNNQPINLINIFRVISTIFYDDFIMQCYIGVDFMLDYCSNNLDDYHYHYGVSDNHFYIMNNHYHHNCLYRCKLTVYSDRIECTIKKRSKRDPPLKQVRPFYINYQIAGGGFETHAGIFSFEEVEEYFIQNKDILEKTNCFIFPTTQAPMDELMDDFAIYLTCRHQNTGDYRYVFYYIMRQ